MTESFEQFWKAYPKKQGKHNALAAWEKLNPDKGLTENIINAIERAKRSKQWRDEDGRYIPLPATYLNGKRWEDEIEEIPWFETCPDFLAEIS